MFSHIFKYSFKCLLKERAGFFWTLVFPILLATLFNLAFTNIMDGENFEDVNVAIVNSEKAEDGFITTMEDTDLFIIQKTNEGEAKNLLSKGKISGYITCGDELTLTVLKSGMNESMIKSFLDNYAQLTSTVTNVLVNNPQGMTMEFTDTLKAESSYTKEVPISTSNNTTVIYFYSLLAMTCLMSATYGNAAIVNIQANQSQLAARLNVAPTHKLKIFLAHISATFVFQFSTLLIVLAYIKLILGVDFGNSIGYVILLCFVGCFTGISLGTAISSIVKKSENVKIGIIISIVMLGSFLSGLMATSIKYIVKQKFPIIAYINPVNLVTDGLYSLYYYNTYERFFLNIGILSGMSVLFCAITYFVLRGQKYASI